MIEWLLRMTSDDEQNIAAYMSKLAQASPRHTPAFCSRSAVGEGADARAVGSRTASAGAARRDERFQIAAGLVAAGILLFWSLPALIRVIS